MAYDVQFSIPPRDLGRADIKFRVKHNGGVLGTLGVSKGSVVWFPKDMSYGHKIGWVDFDSLMKTNGARAECASSNEWHQLARQTKRHFPDTVTAG